MTNGSSATRGMSVVRAESRNDESNCLFISDPCFPKVPIPTWIAAGIILGAGTNGVPGFLYYVTSKAALVEFTRVLARELRNDGITVNAIQPGLIETKWIEAQIDRP